MENILKILLSEQPPYWHFHLFFKKIKKDINLNNIIVMYTYIMYEIKIIKSITLLNKIFLFFLKSLSSILSLKSKYLS